MQRPYQVCLQCVSDTSDPDITFDAAGICHYCREAERVISRYRFTPEQEAVNLQALSQLLKADRSARYHAILGLSGGVDSSYIVHMARQMGIRPLVVHFDNGWNSQKSISNIKKMIEKCGFDLETLVIHWPAFRDLQRSFFKAGVVDIEMITDHAILATMFRLRKKHGIKYILSGANYTTEHGMPPSWVWRKQDLTNIKSIHKKFGSISLRQFPTMNSVKFQLALKFGWGGTYLEPLNSINYSKRRAIDVLTKEYGWEYYGGKHYESVFTKFYQAYVLPVKFGIDKRRVHLSSLVRNGEMSRPEALAELSQPLYDPEELRIDKAYVLKKLGFTDAEFDGMMSESPHSHKDFATDEWVFDLWRSLSRIIPRRRKKV